MYDTARQIRYTTAPEIHKAVINVPKFILSKKTNIFSTVSFSIIIRGTKSPITMLFSFPSFKKKIIYEGIRNDIRQNPISSFINPAEVSLYMYFPKGINAAQVILPVIIEKTAYTKRFCVICFFPPIL